MEIKMIILNVGISRITCTHNTTLCSISIWWVSAKRRHTIANMRNSIADVLELRLSCTNPSNWRLPPGVGYKSKFFPSLILSTFRIKNTVWLMFITFIFDRCPRSLAALTPVKYNCDSNETSAKDKKSWMSLKVNLFDRHSCSYPSHPTPIPTPTPIMIKNNIIFADRVKWATD